MRKSNRLRENIGIHGAGMTKFDLMRTIGMLGPALHMKGPVMQDEVVKVVDAINDAVEDPDPDNIVAYSRGAAVLAAAVATKQIPEMPPVTLLAPAIYRGWGDAPTPRLPVGSIVMIGERDDKVSLKQAARIALEARVPMYVVPGLSHTGILYTRAKPTEDSYLFDSAGYLSDPKTPDWGAAPATASVKQLELQIEMAKKYSFNKFESMSTVLRDLIRESLLLELRNVGGEGPPSSSKYFARPIGDGYVLYYDVGPGGRPQAIPGTIGQHYDISYAGGVSNVSGKDYRLSPEQLAKAEEFVSLGIFKKKEEPNKYPDIEFSSSRKGSPGSAGLLWKSEKDVPTTSASYYPKSPQYDFLLVDTDKKLVSLDDSWGEGQARRGGAKPSGRDTGKSYVMPSGDVAFTSDTLTLQKLFDHLVSVDQRVTPDYKIISPDDKFEGKTIGQVADEPRATDIAVGGTPGKLIVYHGTSTKRWPEIQKKGMLPGKFEEGYVDQIKGYSEKNIYFTMDPHTAENYATRAAIWDKAAALILKVEIPDITKIVPDEDSMGWFDLKREYTLKRTTGQGEDYRGDYDLKTGRYPTVEFEREDQQIQRNQHVKNIFGFLKQANQTTAYGKSEADAPDAEPEFVKDEEYNALLKDIEQNMAGFLTKSLGGETFAYKGWIPPKFVKKWKEYPRTAYPSVVGTGGGTGTEYEDTRQKVLKKVKRFDKNESLVRSLIRGMLTESSDDGFMLTLPSRRDSGAIESFMKRLPFLVRESLEGFTSKTSGTSYGQSDPKQMPRELKQAWSAEADHEFFKKLVKVHWISGMPKSHFRVFERMKSFLNASSKDEISTMGYIGRPSISQWGEFGVMVKGRTTLAANDMNAISSGYYRDIDPDEIEKYRKTSGIPRRASTFNPGKAKGFILDEESFGRQYLGNELIVDNWRPTGLVAPLRFFNGLKEDVPLLGKRRLEQSFENLVLLFVTTDLPVYTNNGTPKDMTPFKEMLGAQ